MRKIDMVSLLLAARAEIAWWVGEHGCCKGHEEPLLSQIDASLAALPGIDKAQRTIGQAAPFAMPEGVEIISHPMSIRGKPGEWYLDLGGVLYRNTSIAPYGPWEPVPTSGYHMVNGVLCEWSIDRGDPPEEPPEMDFLGPFVDPEDDRQIYYLMRGGEVASVYVQEGKTAYPLSLKKIEPKPIDPPAYNPERGPIISFFHGAWYSMRDDGVTWDRLEPGASPIERAFRAGHVAGRADAIDDADERISLGVDAAWAEYAASLTSGGGQ